MTVDIEKDISLTVTRKRDILDTVGDDGPWQRRIFLIMLFCGIPSATHNLAMSFFAPKLDHWCARPSTENNLSVELWKRVALDPANSECFRYTNINLSAISQDIIPNTSKGNYEHNEVEACDSWEYDESFYTSTVLSQWDLVCEREWLVSLSKSIFMAGYMVSALVFGQLADKLGRRPIISTCAVITVFSGIICAFSTSFVMFAVSRFFVAIGISGVFNTGFVLLMEILGTDSRPVYGIAVEFGWCFGFVSLPVIAWWLRDWFWIQIVLTAPCLLMLPVYWMVPESPRWLLSQGRVEDAMKVLTKAAVKNGKQATDVEEQVIKCSTKAIQSGEEQSSSGASVLDLIRTPGLWQKTLNIFFLWFVNAFVYYGLSYNTNELAGDPFINFAISGAVEFPAYIITIFVVRSLGRRNPLAAAMITGGIACLFILPLPLDPWWLIVGVSMLGKFCITCSFGIAFVFTVEIFPTVARNVGLGTASLCARFGSILAPFVRELGHATHPALPMLLFGILSALGGMLVLLLPDTNNCSVPDSIEEAAALKRNQKIKSEAQNGCATNMLSTSNGNADVIREDSSTPAVVTSSPKLHGKEKLADVPEESPELPVGEHELTMFPEASPDEDIPEEMLKNLDSEDLVKDEVTTLEIDPCVQTEDTKKTPL